MKKSIKALVFVLCLTMCAAFAACNKEPSASGTEASENVSSAAVSDTESDLPSADDTSTVVESSETVSENDDTQPYSEVLANYKKVTDSMIDGTFDVYTSHDDLPYINDSLKYKWTNMINELNASMSESRINLGYALYDIDNDGMKELFLINDKHDILAIFTVIDGKVQLLDAYWARYYGVLCEDDVILTRGSGGAAYFETTVYKLSNGVFTEVLNLGCEEGVYYIFSGNDKTEITEKEYYDKENSYVGINESLEFIGI